MKDLPLRGPLLQGYARMATELSSEIRCFAYHPASGAEKYRLGISPSAPLNTVENALGLL
ncbi:hypothetical protein CCOS865_02677 [Pseudomonas reidholzensis]|uniref:Uncharacterized protein n=1 Tax=Pseudomonas reidholzensis TaxID=1785162 RepID=A0A383RVF3_9PSED|nr:hypothetical protein CCOS865_02677 [Pseudomonas reidholzensis]